MAAGQNFGKKFIRNTLAVLVISILFYVKVGKAGAVSGIVSDENGVPVGGASVSVYNVEGEVESSTTTDSTGVYSLLVEKSRKCLMVVSKEGGGFKTDTFHIVSSSYPLEYNVTLRKEGGMHE